MASDFGVPLWRCESSTSVKGGGTMASYAATHLLFPIWNDNIAGACYLHLYSSAGGTLVAKALQSPRNQGP